MNIGDNIIMTTYSYKKIILDMKKHFKNTDLMSITDFKNITSTSRKYAVPLLEYLDKNKITYRDGNNRKLVK